MVVGIKDVAKLMGISIISCCAVLVCALFLNYYIDILQIEDLLSSEQAVIYYHAQVSTAKVVCLVSGGCLLLTSVVMLFFYVKHYIDTHKKELGILKALGYSNLKIAGNFWVFGTGVFLGTTVGFLGAFLLMPEFYERQNEVGILPKIAISFHPSLLLYLVILPTIAFAMLAVFYASLKLKRPVLALLKNDFQSFSKVKRFREGKDCPFLEDLRKHTLRTKKTLAFFIVFASFCFSAMMQMSASMDELASEMMAAMMLLIGMVLAFTTLLLAITTVIKGNTKTIAMMRVFGYSQKECCRALLGGYRPLSYIGFVLGTVYQYVLLRIMVDIVFKDMEGMPAYEFDFPMMLRTLVFFLVVYELVMYCYAEQIKKISVKEIMLE
jgi:ABC-type lipoprotein release transport system permease subunit